MKCISNDLDILDMICRNLGGQEIDQSLLSFEDNDFRKERRVKEVNT